VGNPWYLHAAMTPGAVRIDLDGNPSGAVSAEEADAAAARSASEQWRRKKGHRDRPDGGLYDPAA
jgi:sRNA-binding protein